MTDEYPGDKPGIADNDDAHQQKQINAGLQPFTLVKYFSFSALGVFLIFTLFLSWVISNHARDVMLKQSEDYSLLLAENLNQQVFRRFVLPAVVRYGRIALSNPEQFEYLDRIVTGLVQGLAIDSVTIFDSSENIISYSTVAKQVGLKDKGGIEYDKALKGIANSRIIYSGSVLSLISDATISCQLKTYIPFRQVKESGEAGEVIMGVIEIVKDLSKDYTAILKLQSRIILVSSVVMTVLFLVLRTIVSRAGKIIERRTMERFRLEEQLNKTERLAHLGTMVATVSHEIKSPLGIVRSTAEILKKRIARVAPGNENLAQIIIDETSRLNTIVTEFLDFARPQQPILKEIDIHHILDRVVRFVRSMAEEQQVGIITDFRPETLIKQVDEDMLYRAFLNILLNGIQAMKDGGTMTITTEKLPDGTASIELSDTGCGMTSEKVEQIFQPFYTDKSKGTGLGLAIVRNSIASHDGRIQVSSTIDNGTSFTIILP
ncbi:MAG: ATP-binding protein [Desulfocapsaceae bacterium]|jgi:signal transduction histidine kinase|nr:ATP-binding protein [Desulfocapsaceae bacterium]